MVVCTRIKLIVGYNVYIAVSLEARRSLINEHVDDNSVLLNHRQWVARIVGGHFTHHNRKIIHREFDVHSVYERHVFTDIHIISSHFASD